MRIMAVLSHPDDELGCAGTLSKHAKRGDEVMLAWTTYGELASFFVEHTEAEVKRIRQEHGRHVASRLGASHHFFDMGDSRMTGSRREALQLAQLYCRFRPDAIITWADDHAHPDHHTTARVAIDAVTLARIPKIVNEGSSSEVEAHRGKVRIYQYASGASPRPMVHVDISAEIGIAQELFAFYQGFYGWDYTPEAYVERRAAIGREVGVKYAEKFQLRGDFAPAFAFLP